MYGVFFLKFLGMQPAMATQFYKWSDDWAMKQFNSVRTDLYIELQEEGGGSKSFVLYFFLYPSPLCHFHYMIKAVSFLQLLCCFFLGRYAMSTLGMIGFPFSLFFLDPFMAIIFFWQSFVAFHHMSLLFVVDHFLNGLEWSWVENVFMYIIL